MTLRIALVLLAIVSAALAYPWHTDAERWTVGVAAVVLIVVLAWWRGLFVTTMIGRRLAIARRNLFTPKSSPGTRATQLLRVDDPRGVGLPHEIVARYVDRFGIRCDHVRITDRQADGVRTTWVGLTVDAKDNLAALQARSPRLPLFDTAETVGRRLADQLRETGLEVTVVDDSAEPLVGRGRERWSSVRDDDGSVSVYGVRGDERLPERLAELRALPGEVWTAVEFGGTAAYPTVAAVCAIRTDAPVKTLPMAGLIALRGVQRPILNAMDPKSTESLGIATAALQAGPPVPIRT